MCGALPSGGAPDGVNLNAFPLLLLDVFTALELGQPPGLLLLQLQLLDDRGGAVEPLDVGPVLLENLVDSSDDNGPQQQRVGASGRGRVGANRGVVPPPHYNHLVLGGTGWWAVQLNGQDVGVLLDGVGTDLLLRLQTSLCRAAELDAVDLAGRLKPDFSSSRQC